MYKYTETDLLALCPGRGTIVVYFPRLSKVFITCLIEATHLMWQAVVVSFVPVGAVSGTFVFGILVPFITILPLQ